MRSATPVITIGMPAYNASATIRESIESILAQHSADLELVISDNASTDDTWQIIDEYRRLDSRIVAFRQTENIGANGNYSAVFRAARGGYFKWASSNDWCAPQLVAECLAALERRPDAVLAAPGTRLFTVAPSDAVDYEGDVAFDDADPITRFTRVLQELKLNNLINGVMRTAALSRTRLIEHYPGADNVMLAHLALLGPILVLPERHFYRRMDAATATRLMSAEAIHRHHYPSRTVRALFPNWRIEAGLIRAVLSSRLPPRGVMRGLAWITRHTYWNHDDLLHDLVQALRYPLKD